MPFRAHASVRALQMTFSINDIQSSGGARRVN